jgi:hypothetical protein
MSKFKGSGEAGCRYIRGTGKHPMKGDVNARKNYSIKLPRHSFHQQNDLPFLFHSRLLFYYR